MAVNNFIPEVWAARLLMNLHKKLVYAQAGVVNRDYEGDIQEKGDTVRILSVGPVSVSTYTKNQDHAAPETLDDAALILQITESKMYNFQIDDVDKAQANVALMESGMREAGYALANTADQFVAGKYTEAATANLIGTTASPKTDLATLGRAYDYLVQLSVKLDEADISEEGRYAVVPPWFHGLLLQDERFVGFSTAESQAALRRAQIGTAAGFDILKSNNVPNTSGDKYRITAGHPSAIAYADQVNKTEAYRPQLRFADAVKGLHLYGAKVVRPNALAVLTANPPAS